MKETEAPRPPGKRGFGLSRLDVMTRVFVAICYGFAIFGAAILPVLLLADCLSGSGVEACRWTLLPLALLQGVAGAPFVFLMAFFMAWPLVVAALVAGLAFPRAIDAALGAWTAGAGLVAWLLACLILDRPHRRAPFPEWWLDRLSSADGAILAFAVVCIAGVFLSLTRRDLRRGAGGTEGTGG